MKIFTFLALFIFSSATYAQTSKVVVKDTNYLYTDTINKKVYFGNYEPTGLVKTRDGGCIVSTQFGIYFRNYLDTALLHTKIDSTRQYSSREHISSGSVFKLNRQYKKDWETVFKEQRIKEIQPYDDTTFIAAGEKTDQKNIWVARINSSSGKVIWFKEFYNKRKPGLEDLCISSTKQIIFLSESKCLVPLSIRKQYKRMRFVFFEEPENSAEKVMLFNISGNGELNWKRNLHISRKWEMFDERISADSIISIVSTYRTSEKKRIKNKSEYRDLNFAYNLAGNKLIKHTDKRDGLCLGNIGGWLYFSDSHSDTLRLAKYDARMNKILDRSIIIPHSYSSLENITLINNYYYLFGATNIKEVMVCKLDSSFKLLNSMIYQTAEMVTDTKLAMSPNGHIMVIGGVFKNDEPETKKPYQYIDLIEFDLK